MLSIDLALKFEIWLPGAHDDILFSVTDADIRTFQLLLAVNT